MLGHFFVRVTSEVRQWDELTDAYERHQMRMKDIAIEGEEVNRMPQI